MSRNEDECTGLIGDAGARERVAARLHVPDGHAGVCATIDLLLHHGAAPGLFDCPPVAHHLVGMALPAGHADFVLFHDDGSATVIQAAAAGSDLEILAALGPLTFNAMRVAREWVSGRVRRVLAAGVPGEGYEHIDAACNASGVLFVPIGTNEEHRDIQAATLARLTP